MMFWAVMFSWIDLFNEQATRQLQREHPEDHVEVSCEPRPPGMAICVGVTWGVEHSYQRILLKCPLEQECSETR
jgi:hypothetical protein